MNFKVGDRVRIRDKCLNCIQGEICTVFEFGGELWARGRYGACNCKFNWILINDSNQSTMRKRYRLLKDTPVVKKGAIYEEECEDGTQPFRCITPEYVKFKGYEDHKYSTREVIENNPEWFERVEPLYVPASKLAKVREILGLEKAKRGRPKRK